MTNTINFIPKTLVINCWEDIQPYFDKLIQASVTSINDLENLLLHFSETVSVFQEQSARAYISMTCHTDNESFVKRHELFSTEIDPKLEVAVNEINQKILHHPLFNQLPDERYQQYKLKLKHEVEMFREENIPLDTELSQLSTQFSQTAGKLTATIDGEELPLPMASTKLLSNDRNVRKQAWLAIYEARYKVKPELDKIFDEMVKLRNQISLNAGYKNFRDYQHANLQRFDYTPLDVETFHDSMQKYVLPLAKEIQKQYRAKLGLEKDFRPWDIDGEPLRQKPLKPFEQASELLDKAVLIFSELKSEFGNNLLEMKKNNLFDLEARKAKAPGGYNYPLHVTGMPFIFMNAAGTHGDVTTLMHEGGHAMHTFLTQSELLIDYRETPSEMAETASMSMELLTSHLWGKFYDQKDLVRARREHLEHIILFFPWCAIVDAFQHWIYLNPQHTHEQRDAQCEKLMNQFGLGLVDWSGFEHYRRNSWQKQLHIFEVPFYYIEYGIAQLGALQVYRNYLKDPQKGLAAYIRGLKLGSSKSLPEVWRAMDIKFDFSAATIQELMSFVQDELEKLTLTT